MLSLNKTSVLRRMVSSNGYYSNRMARMDRECSFYVEQMSVAKNGILRKAFARMASIYLKRYAYYLQKCTENELRNRIQASPRSNGNV
jgi:hypothetical protein